MQMNAQRYTMNAQFKKRLVTDAKCIFNSMPSFKIYIFKVSHQSSSLPYKLEKPQS